MSSHADTKTHAKHVYRTVIITMIRDDGRMDTLGLGICSCAQPDEIASAGASIAKVLQALMSRESIAAAPDRTLH